MFRNWSSGSVIRGWLVRLKERGRRECGPEDLSDYVEDTREVKWAVEYALAKEAWIPVIAQAEFAVLSLSVSWPPQWPQVLSSSAKKRVVKLHGLSVVRLLNHVAKTYREAKARMQPLKKSDTDRLSAVSIS